MRLSLFHAHAALCSCLVLSLLSACGDADTGSQTNSLIDNEPVAGDAALSVATVTPATTEAGQAATVGCALQDANGLTLPNASFTFEVLPAAGVTQTGVEVVSSVPGEYKVLCSFDMASEIAQQPATWTITPGAGQALVLTADPPQEAYALDQPITILGRIVDAEGNTVQDGVELTSVLAEPKQGFSGGGEEGEPKTAQFEEGGTYVLTAETAAGLTADLTLTIDGSPPVIEITSPARGLSALEPGQLVQGKVTDDRGVAWLKLGETAVPLEDDGTFSVEWTLGYGVSLLALTAADMAGNEASTWRSADYSTERYPMNPPDMETDGVPDALQITLNQDGMDSMAELLTKVLAGLDLGAMLGTAPLGEFLFCDYIVSQLEYTDPDIVMTLEEGQLRIVMTLKNLVVRVKNSGVNQATSFQCTINNGEPDGPSWATGPLKFDADSMTVVAIVKFNVTKESAGIEVEVESVDLENMWPNDIPDLPVINDIIDFIIETFVSLITPLVEGLVNDLIGGLISDFAINQDIDLPNLGGGDPHVLSLATELSSIAVSPESMRVAMIGLTSAADVLRPHPNFGSMKYAGCGPTETLPIAPLDPMLIAIHDDFANELLFSVWDTGMLSGVVDPSVLGDSVDLTSFGVSELTASLDALLPPFLNTCSGQMVLELGDLLLDVDMIFADTPTHFALWLQGGIPITIEATKNPETGQTELGFELGDLSALTMEIVINEGFFGGNDASLLTVIKSALLPLIVGGLGEGVFSFPLPVIDLSDLVPGIPAGTGVALDIEKLGPQGGTIRLLGALIDPPPAPEPPIEPEDPPPGG